ncbi:MAG: DegT/DnrJ/EryC1/StrS family aminotransferase [Deltaproteobacteria bacterium]|nr:DegT/DnrJ/EryC1/StrS family aminotransferase [Deltaproteobacteria bacterium]
MAGSKSKIRQALSRAKNWVQKGAQYPWALRNEVAQVTRVLRSSQWNMGYGVGQVHETLEKEFAEYTGCAEAVAVNTGGMALQVAMRALGITPADEVVHQIDTCLANAFAVLNAGGTPIFVDSNPETMGLSIPALEKAVGPHTKLIVPVHLWGNPDNISEIKRIAQTRNIPILEDCCLALGATDGAGHVGHQAAAAVFSFGCVKPIQAGEGGMIVAQDRALAKEMRAIRNWGDRMREFGEGDVKTLAWNGRMSEIIAAVALEQLRGYPTLLKEIRANTEQFVDYLKKIPWVTPVHSPGRSSYNQFILRFHSERAPFSRDSFSTTLRALGAGTEPANFEPMNRYSFFKKGSWKTWVPQNRHLTCTKNYNASFPNADRIFDHTHFGICRNNFLGKDAVKTLIQRFEKAINESTLHREAPPLAVSRK